MEMNSFVFQWGTVRFCLQGTFCCIKRGSNTRCRHFLVKRLLTIKGPLYVWIVLRKPFFTSLVEHDFQTSFIYPRMNFIFWHVTYKLKKAPLQNSGKNLKVLGFLYSLSGFHSQFSIWSTVHQWCHRKTRVFPCSQDFLDQKRVWEWAKNNVYFPSFSKGS